MARLKIKDSILGAYAVCSEVRIGVYKALLLHAERFDHLAHFLDGLWLYDALGNLIIRLLFCAYRRYFLVLLI